MRNEEFGMRNEELGMIADNQMAAANFSLFTLHSSL